MPVVNIARRLSGKVIQTDIDSLNGLGIVDTYIPVRSEAAPQALRNTYETMLAKQQHETELTVTLKAASDDARQAEWNFHNAILAMKESIKGQFGPDSNASQAVGYKKKSEYKRRTRRNA
jgi:dihydroxyacetone kinase-like predicted kinase